MTQKYYKKPEDALKVQELLLFLDMLDLESIKKLNQYVSNQVELIKEMHKQMTSDLKCHYTIEELSKKYLMNTTSLKSVFKAVYGMPIASYIKQICCCMKIKLFLRLRLLWVTKARANLHWRLGMSFRYYLPHIRNNIENNDFLLQNCTQKYKVQFIVN